MATWASLMSGGESGRRGQLGSAGNGSRGTATRATVSGALRFDLLDAGQVERDAAGASAFLDADGFAECFAEEVTGDAGLHRVPEDVSGRMCRTGNGVGHGDASDVGKEPLACLIACCSAGSRSGWVWPRQEQVQQGR